MILNNKSFIRKIVERIFQNVFLFYDASPYFGECGKKLMWKGQAWVVICNIINEFELFIRFCFILI